MIGRISFALTSLLLMAATGPHWTDDPHASVTNDGTSVTAAVFPQPASEAPFLGPALPAPLKSSKKPVDGPQYTGIFNDSTLASVSPSLPFPNRAVVFINSKLTKCSGWLYGPDIVATAGHCLHQGGGGHWAEDVTVAAGREGSQQPFGVCRAKRLYAVKAWLETGDERYDYGAIKLDCTVGQLTGWFGYGWSDKPLVNDSIRHTGYPNRTKFVQQLSEGTITDVVNDEIFYNASSWIQMSGGPVFSTTNCTACVVGIHAHILHPNGIPPFTTRNHGPAISRRVFENLKAWKDNP